MPFICSFCGGAFCPQHRLPESHNCSEYWRVRTHRQSLFSTMTPPDIRAYRAPSVRLTRSAFRFSPTEVRHILIGVILVSGVGLSFFAPQVFSNWLAIAAAVFFFTAGFITHELTHKAMAQRYGMWAEFRLDMFGAALTLLSAVSPLKIIAPGAVVIAGDTTPDRWQNSCGRSDREHSDRELASWASRGSASDWALGGHVGWGSNQCIHGIV